MKYKRRNRLRRLVRRIRNLIILILLIAAALTLVPSLTTPRPDIMDFVPDGSVPSRMINPRNGRSGECATVYTQTGVEVHCLNYDD